MNVSSRLSAQACAAMAFACLAGCATSVSAVRVDKSQTDLSKCHSFDWLPASTEAASFTAQRVRAAALQELQEKGYTLSTDKPACRITYVLSTYERPQPKPNVGVGAGGGSGGVRGGIGVSVPIGRRNEQAGTFTLDVIDVAQQAQIWSGSIDASFERAELSEKEARAVVRKVLGEFPDRLTPNR